MADYMARALALAEMAKGSTGNNPAVGAVLVRDGRIVGEGYTQPPGRAHAEIVALRQAGELARGATLYVTLEPCCHHGRTPPCTTALIEAGVARVEMALLDPNPLVSGGGKAALEQAGIETAVGSHEGEASNGESPGYEGSNAGNRESRAGPSLPCHLMTIYGGDNRCDLTRYSRQD